MTEVEIVNLAGRPEWLETVARWRWEEWGRPSGSSYEYTLHSTRHNTQPDRIPMTFVALSDGQPVGTVSLWTNDLRSRQDLYPWLASLYVHPDHRGKGVGTQLQARAVAEARKLGHRMLYLFTNHVGYYEKLGWTFRETGWKPNGQQVRIYEREL